jgi:transcriptional repressor NrdR
VTKRDGREETFDELKIRIGLSKAFKKHAGVGEKINEIFNSVISEIISKFPEKISSRDIGTIIMNTLKNRDQVAYLRFASIHKNFESADDFASEFAYLRGD